MIKKIQKASLILLSILLLVFITSTISNAASSNASISKTTVTVGDTFTVTIKAENAAGTYTVETSNSNATLTSGSASEFLENSSATLTYKATTAGTVQITAKTEMTDLDNSSNNVSTSKTFTVTINSASTGSDTGSSSNGSSTGGSTSTTTPEKKLTFKDASSTVYVTKDNINLRSDYSTTSGAVQVKKGTELKVTGVSTEKSGGYIWYRVTYEGKTRYVAKDFVTETKPEEEKSNNVNLKKLEITGVELEPKFSADVTEYTAKISNYKEKELNVTAEAEDEKTTVKIEGNDNIKIGENIIKITTTAEDETTKVYIIKLTNEETDAFGLASLKIKDVELKSFKTDKYEYEVSFSNLDKLEIEAIANQEGATIEIIGNEDLKEGENIITIVVTSKDGEEVATYQIKAKKLTTLGQNQNRELNIVNIALSAVIALIVIITIAILIVKYVKNKDNLQDYKEDDEEDFGHNNIFKEDENEEDYDPYTSLDKEAEDDNEINYEENEYDDEVAELPEEEKIDSEYTEEIENIENNEIAEVDENESQRYNKYSVDDLFKQYEDQEEQRPRRHGKGKHSK